MIKEPYTQKLFTNVRTLILHEKDWESRLGTLTFQEMVDAGGLVRPTLAEIEGQEFSYFIKGTYIDSEVVVEGDSLFVSPLVDGYEVISVKFQDIGLWKFSQETAASYIRRINNLSLVQLDTVNSNRVKIIGEFKLPNISFLVVWVPEGDITEGYLENIIPEVVRNKFQKIIVLGNFESTLKSKFITVSYQDFVKLPLSLFKDVGTPLKCEQLAAHFKYPLVIDTENKFIFVFGKKFGVKRETNLYKFIHAMAISHPSLPMDTEKFFLIHKITMESHETAIKELRSQLREKIEGSGLDKTEMNQATSFFDLVSGEKSWGDVNLKLDPQSIHFW